MKSILITGSHGVGKSSFLFHLASLLKQKHRTYNIEIIQENVREIKKQIGSLNTPEFQMASINDYLLKEAIKGQVADIIISDRGAYDVVIYGDYFGTPVKGALRDLAIEQLKRFDQVYFIRPDKQHYLADDGFRMTSLKQMREIDAQFEEQLAIQGVKPIELKTSEIFQYDVKAS